MPSFIRILAVSCLLLLSLHAQQVEYQRWWQYENRAAKLSPEQLSVTTQLAQQGDVESEMLLAAAYQKGIGVAADRSEWLRWVQRAAQHGAPEAQYTLGNLYRKGTQSFAADPAQVVLWTSRAAENGHIVAMHNLGTFYLGGFPTLPRDQAKGEMWLTRSAEGGFTHAMLLLGDVLLKGDGRPRDPENGERWMRLAAERGHVMAMLRLAEFYSSADEAPRDPDFVERILLRASEMGRPEAQYYLARMYRRGMFGAINQPAALEWFEISAAKKYAPASFALGEMHEKGEGVTANSNTAAQLYLEAASLGYSPAVCKVGEIHYRGRGVPQNNAEAYKWLLIGARKGAPECRATQLRLEKELKEPQRQQITTDAESWMAAHPREMAQPLGKFRWPFGVWVPDDPPPDPRPPSTPEEREKMVRLVAELEAQPWGDTARQNATWLMQWIQEVPDIYFHSCPDLLEKEKAKSDYPLRRRLEQQMFFSGAAYQVQHREGKDQLAIYHAGLLGGLRAYQSLLARDPSSRWPVMDALLERRAKGSLLEYVHQQANTNCR